LILKAGKSDFVKTKHVDAIKRLFPVYTLATLRDCGHWLHAEKPLETADAVHRFITLAATEK
jgi:esterase